MYFMDRLQKSPIFYGWWIVSSVLISLILHSGTYYSFGVFYKPIQMELGWSRADISWALFLNQAVHGIGYVVVGTLMDRYNPRKVVPVFACCLLAGFILASRAVRPWHLYLSYGVIAGIGFGLGYGSLAGVVARWFEKKRGLVLGIVSSGAAVGTMTVPPTISRLIQDYGWRTSMVILGILLFTVFMVVAFVVKRTPEEKGMLPYGASASPFGGKSRNANVSLTEALKQRVLWIIVVAFATYTIGQQMVMFHVVNHATDVGIDPMAAAGFLSLTGLGSLTGRLLLGGLSDRFRPVNLMRISMLVMAVALPVLIFLNSIPGFTIFSLSFGFLYGGIVPLQAATVQSFFGSRSMGSVYGFVICALLVVGGLGPLWAGYVFDVTQSYAIAFGCAAILCVLATAVTFLIRKPNRTA